MSTRAWLAAAVVPALAGCTRAQSMLHSAGPQAGRIEALWWTFLGVAIVVWVLVAIALAIAAIRRHRTGPAPIVRPPGNGGDSAATLSPLEATGEAEHRRIARPIGIALAASLAVLLVLLVVSTLAGRATSALVGEAPLSVEIVGHQWWWEIKYADPVPSRAVVTANELHIPVGTAVKIHLNSRDVIHSLWIPSLHGKKDLVPGHEGQITIRADRAGEYRGQCAEFCGLQHAHMALWVVAEPPERFQQWLEAQRQSAPQPQGGEAARGQQVFMQGPCALCHTIQGTDARATTGPDLTHLMSRRTLAAGTLPNTRGHLAGWITDPQRVKPGNHMPPVLLDAADLQALLTYLETLR